MSDDNSSSIELNRRRVLGALGTVGVASAGAGAGTFALFSDTESSTGNSVQAGTLNLTADGNDGSTTTTLNVTEAVPGGSGTETTTLRNTGNIDGYLSVTVDDVSSAENGITEPERDAGDSSTGDEFGELAEYVNLDLAFSEDFGSGNVQGMEDVQFNPNTLLPDGSGRNFEIRWEIDENAGNVVQSDSVSIDFTFELVQKQKDADVVLTGDTPYGQGAGFSDPWTTTTQYAHSGAGAWGVRSEDTGKYGFYFAGDDTATDALPTYTVEEIQNISYWLYEPNALDQSDIYLNIYTKSENDGNDSGWYDSRLQALPQEANRGNPNFTPGEWNKFTTETGATNTLTWADTGRGGNFTQDLPTLDQVQSGTLDWSNWGAGQSFSHDYRDEQVRALSLQAGSGETVEAYIDDVTVELTSGETVTYDLEP